MDGHGLVRERMIGEAGATLPVQRLCFVRKASLAISQSWLSGGICIKGDVRLCGGVLVLDVGVEGLLIYSQVLDFLVGLCE